MISDTPGRGGRGVKKGQIFADVLYGWPLGIFRVLACETNRDPINVPFVSLCVEVPPSNACLIIVKIDSEACRSGVVDTGCSLSDPMAGTSLNRDDHVRDLSKPTSSHVHVHVDVLSV